MLSAGTAGPEVPESVGGSKKQEVSKGQQFRGPWVEGGEEASDSLLTHLQQEGNSQRVGQCACQPLQMPQ